jgi:ADP-ribosyl-[dinitrogen reductase] hydrolase
MRSEKINEIGDNLLIAVAYGDSCGLPVETQKRQYIQKTYGEIRSLLPVTNPYFGEGPAGVWSDDTTLSLAVAESLTEKGEFSMDSMVKHHIKAMDETPVRSIDGVTVPRGWGKSTWESVTKLKLGQSNWANSGNPEGEGNGVLMKLAPLALWQALRPSNSSRENEEVEQLATMTHDNDLSVVTALVHRDIIRGLFLGQINQGHLVEEAATRALSYEKTYWLSGNKTSKLLGKLALIKFPTADEILSIAPRGFHSSETLVMAYGAFSRQSHFPSCVYEAVSYGGDTDSIASIVAAMSVISSGEMERPHDLDVLEEKERLRTVGRNLVQAAIS